MNVLFVCTGNTCRSPMAEHLFRRMLKDAGKTDVTVRSAGVSPATSPGLPKEASAALAEEGIHDVKHRPSGLDRALIDWADVILVMERAHRAAILAGFPDAASKTNLLKSEGIADPYGGTTDEYRATLAEIKTALTAVIRNWTH